MEATSEAERATMLKGVECTSSSGPSPVTDEHSGQIAHATKIARSRDILGAKDPYATLD